MSKHILVVDDEPSIVKGLRFNLEQQEGYIVSEAHDGQEALDNFFRGKFDMVLLDLMLPKIDGMEVCQKIRSNSDVPIIMLTAKDSDIDKLTGLEFGADDYMTKPFNMLELKARIKAIFRRSEGAYKHEDNDVIKVLDIVVNANTRTVEIAGENVELTAKEFDLLHLMITNRGKVFSREDLLNTVWKNDYDGDLRTVDVHVRRLRKKIEKNPAEPEYVLTKWGVGYYFTVK
ncbi:MAG: response regulator transcription factor [Eubacteriales bacterium]